jgi:hypothetical protein
MIIEEVRIKQEVVIEQRTPTEGRTIRDINKNNQN